jgi:hypothetical protein
LWVAYDRRINLDQSLPNLDVPIGSNSGLWKKDLKSGTITHYSYHPEKGHPLWEQVSDIEQTEDGKIWFTILDIYFADAFRFFDMDDNRTIDFIEFFSGLDKLRIKMSEQDALKCFKYLNSK